VRDPACSQCDRSRAAALCSPEQRVVQFGTAPPRHAAYAVTMPLKQIKMAVAGVWVIAAAVVGLVLGISSPGALALVGAFGLLPPLGMMFLWNEPRETLSESIHGGRD
jgi:hypothetical protein